MSMLEKYQTLLKTASYDALLLTSRVNRQYAAGYDIAEGMTLITETDAYFFTDSRYIEDAEQFLPDFIVQMVDRAHPYTERLNGVLCHGIKTLGYEEDYMTVGEYQRLAEKLTAELTPAQREISAFRQVKTAAEIADMREAQRITDSAFAEMLNVIHVGMTEMEVKTELLYRLYQYGSQGPSFDPIVISGAKTSVPHGVSGEKKLEAGDFVTMDFGCKVNGYCSDMTRTIALDHATDEMKQVYKIVYDAQEAALAVTKAGKTGREIDAAARDYITAAGYGACFGHGYGHGLGLEIHENPNCSPSWDQPLPAGCVCSAEPGIYIPGKFGVRIEDVVCLTEDGCMNFTHSPKNLIIL